MTVAPAMTPIPMAAKVFASVISAPSTPQVRTIISGSITGDAKQKAITGASGTPARNNAAINGTTPQEQKGDSAPKRAPVMIAVSCLPERARAIVLSAPVALMKAAIITLAMMKGPVSTRFFAAKLTIEIA